jgi:hypothetical protein
LLLGRFTRLAGTTGLTASGSRASGSRGDMLPQPLPLSGSCTERRGDHGAFGGGCRGGARSRCGRCSCSARCGLVRERRRGDCVHVGVDAGAPVAGDGWGRRNRERGVEQKRERGELKLSSRQEGKWMGAGLA